MVGANPNHPPSDKPTDDRQSQRRARPRNRSSTPGDRAAESLVGNRIVARGHSVRPTSPTTSASASASLSARPPPASSWQTSGTVPPLDQHRAAFRWRPERVTELGMARSNSHWQDGAGGLGFWALDCHHPTHLRSNQSVGSRVLSPHDQRPCTPGRLRGRRSAECPRAHCL